MIINAVLIERKVHERHGCIDYADDDNNGANAAVQVEYAAHAKAILHLRYEVGQSQPPQHCAYDNRQETDGLPHKVGRDYECKHIEEGNEEKNNERIAKCKSETRNKVVEQRAAALHMGAKTLAGVLAIGVQSEYEQHYAADEFEPKEGLSLLDEVDYERHAEARDECVDKVAKGGTGSCDESVTSALLHGALNAEDADWAHRGRYNNAYNQSFEYQLQCRTKFYPKL